MTDVKAAVAAELMAKQWNGSLGATNLRQGVIVSYDATTGLASIQLGGDTDTQIDGVVVLPFAAAPVAGEATWLLQNGSDLLALGSASAARVTTYVPLLTSDGTQPTLGTGSVQESEWGRIGPCIHYEGRIQFGTSGAAAGTGTYAVSLPVAATAANSRRVGGYYIKDASPDTNYDGACRLNTTTTFQMIRDGASGLVGAASPMAWTNNDVIRWGITYFAA